MALDNTLEYRRDRLNFAMVQRKTYPGLLKRSIHPNAHINHEFVVIGANAWLMPGCVIGWPGLGWVWDNGWKHIPHCGGVVIGDNVVVYPGANIARGTVGDTVVCEGTLIDANVHIGHNAKVGRHCFIVAGTVVGGSCNVGDNVYLGEGCKIKDHITIADGVYLGAGSVVTKDCDKPHWVYANKASDSGMVYAQPMRERTEVDI